MAEDMDIAKMREPRTFVDRFRSAVLNSKLPAMPKFVLLTLAEFDDGSGAPIIVSVADLARLAKVSEKTVRRSLQMAEPWFTWAIGHDSDCVHCLRIPAQGGASA